jgi:Helix-turn-helix domain
MRSIAYALPTLPGFAGSKTYAAWPVWRDSTTDTVKFQPLPKKKAAQRWFAAKRFDLQTHEPGKHGGAIGRTALEVLRVLLFEFLDYATGQIDPSYDEIARKAGVCRRTVADALRRLRTLGLLHWQRRSRPEADEAGGFRLVQETNAYASLPPSHWKGYHEPPPAPPPQTGTWGDHPPLPDAITQAADELRAQPSAHRAMLAALEADPGDPLAGALARLGRSLFGPQT